MRGNVIFYIEMCQKEGGSVRGGMNFRMRGGHSVILMSVRANSLYQDEIQEDGMVLLYEGHYEPKRKGIADAKRLDQPEFRQSGALTENEKFHQAAQGFKAGVKGPDIVQVYQKIKPGIWSDNGFFHLVDLWTESDGRRNVFKFKLMAIEGVEDQTSAEDSISEEVARGRIIPTSVKLKVWQRDGGKCVTCGAADKLHFDHVVRYSKGATSLNAENIQMLCARHNLEKSAIIQ